MTRPKMYQKPMVKIIIAIEKEKKQLLQVFAMRQDKTLTQLVQNALDRIISQEGLR